MRSARWSVPNAMLAGVLALALCSGGTVFGGGVFSRAWADEAEEAPRATMRRPRSTRRGAYGKHRGRLRRPQAGRRGVQARVDEISAQAMDAQQAVIEGRAALGKTAVHEYLNGGASQSLVTMVLEREASATLYAISPISIRSCSSTPTRWRHKKSARRSTRSSSTT